MSRRLLFITGVVLATVVALVVFYLYLIGGSGKTAKGEKGAPTGIVHIRSIYVDGKGENLYRPVGVGADPGGGFAVTLRDSQKVVLFDSDGDWIRTWGERGLSPGNLIAPLGVAYDRRTDHVYVADRSRLRLVTYSSQGKFLWEVPVLNPLNPVVTEDGVLVTTFGPLVKLSPQGELIREVGTRGSDPGQFDYARGAAPVTGGDVIVADSNNVRVQRVKMSGESTATVSWVFGSQPKRQDDPTTTFGLPTSVAIDDKGRAFILDGFRHTISVLDPETGESIHEFEKLDGESEGRFKMPTSIAHLGGNVFAITDTYNDRVQIVRILLPGEDHLVARYPWSMWLLSLLLLPFVGMFGRKKWFASSATLARAQDEGRLRLLAAVARRLHVTPEAYERFSAAEEGGVAIGEYLVAVGEHGEPSNEPQRLIAGMPSGLRRLVSPRVRVVLESEAEAQDYEGPGRKTVLLDELAEGYRLDSEPAATKDAKAEGTA